MITSITCDSNGRATEETYQIIREIQKNLPVGINIRHQGLAGSNLQFAYKKLMWVVCDLGDSLGVTPDTFDTYFDDDDEDLDTRLQAFATEYLTVPLVCETPEEVGMAVLGATRLMSGILIEKFREMYTAVRS